MPFAPPRGRQPSIEWVPIVELLIDESYQRSIETPASRRLVREIAGEWDWDVLDVLKVSRRPDDRLFVIDGQHRLAAARLRPDVPQLPCVLKRCAGPAEEARLFTAANRGRKRMSRVDDFRAAVAAGDGDAVTIERLVTAAGLAIGRHEMAASLAPGELACVAALRTLLRTHGEDRLGEALRTLGEAFPDEQLVSPSAFLAALVELSGERGIDPDRLFQTLLTGTTAEWADWAKLKYAGGGKSKAIALKELIRHRYAATRAAA